MKYKVNDKIKIKTWKAMAKEFGSDIGDTNIPCHCSFNKNMETQLRELYCNRVLTIRQIVNDIVLVKEMSWNFSEDMIRGLETIKKTIDNEQQTFRDLLGRDIKIGDNVLHLCTKLDRSGYPHGGVNKKLATVINQTPKGIGIEWRDKHDKRIIKKSNIKNTRNRLIILDGKKLNLEIDDIVKDVQEAHEKDRKNKNTRIKNLSKSLKKTQKHRDTLFKENEELLEEIETFTKGIERFSILDL